MTKNQLTEYRTALQNKRAELVYGSRSRGSLRIEATADEMDQTQGVQERDLVVETFDRNARLLHDVRSALSRIEAGTFGMCLDCEADISCKRLAAVPWAASCIDCQVESESKGAQPGMRQEYLVDAA